MEKLFERRNLVLTAALAAAAYLGFTYFVIEPELYLMRNYREFFIDFYFFKQFFQFPGYPADYFSRFLIGFYNFHVISSVIITCFVASTYCLMVSIFRNEKKNYWLPLLPVILLMSMHNDYDHDLKNDLNMVCLLVTLNVHLSSVARNSKNAVWVYALLLVFICYFNGFVAATFWLLYLLVILIKHKTPKSQLLWYLVETAIVVIVLRVVFNLTFHDYLQELTDMMRVYSFPLLPFILYLSVFIPIIFYEAKGEFIFRKLKLKPVWLAYSVLILMISVLFLTFSFEQKNGLKVKYFGLKHDWAKVLEYSKKCTNPDRNVSFFTNAALFHTGKICDDLFSYYQGYGSDGLIAPEITDYSEVITNQDIFLQMGALSLSVVWGTEATNVYGANPIVLKNLVKAYLAEGQLKEAQKFLNLMSHSLFCKNWVTCYQRFIDDSTMIDRDPELSEYRRLQLPQAEVFAKGVEMNLYLLSHNSKNNKMAYDYLVISILLDNRMNDFATCLTGLKTYGYTSLPKVYMEGLLYYSLFAKGIPIDPQEFTFDNRVINRFGEFGKDLAAARNDLPRARMNLQAKYGDTYWYYILFESRISDEERNEILARMIG